MNLLPRIFSVLSVLLLTIHVSFAQQDYYWVGGSGNWSDLTHWATSSGGSTTHTTLPTSVDDVFFDGQSFSGSGQVVTIDAVSECHDFDWTGATNFPALNATSQIDIYGSATLNTDVQYDFGDVYFKSADMGKVITSNGASFGTSSTIRFDGDGGWSLVGSLSVKTLYFLKGTFATGNYDITTTGTLYISSTLGSLMDIDFGSSTLNCQSFRNSSASDLVLDAGTSTIITGSFRGDFNNNGPFTYYELIFDEGGTLYNESIFNSVKLLSGLLRIESGTTQTMSDFVADGSKYSTLEIKGLTDDSEATINITSGIVNINFVYLKDFHATGGAIFGAINSIDNGNNTGWNISGPVSKSYYWIGDGGDWDDPTHWATTSGGSTTHGDYPSKFDDVFFDANSFTQTNQTVNVEIPDADSRNMDWTGVTNNPRFYAPYESDVNFYGDVMFSLDMTKSIYNGRVYGEATGLEFHFGGGTIQNFSFNNVGEYTISDPVNCGNFSVSGGIVNMSDITANVSFTFSVQSSNPVNLNLGSSTINTRDFTINATAVGTIIPGTSAINVSRNFTGSGHDYNEVNITGNGTLKGSNTFNVFSIDPGVTLSLEEGMTQTVTSLDLTGSKASPININSLTPGTQTTFSVASGTVNGLYMIMQDIEAIGGATFNADQTIDNGNNTGWNITSITSQDYYWVGGSGVWSDYANHWATSSGGSTFHTGEPGVLDNVFLDANSFSSADDELVIDFSSISMNNLDMSGMDVSAAISGDVIVNIYGSLNISPIAAFYPDEIHFLSDQPETITAKNSYLYTSGEFHIEGSGSFTLLDSLLLRELFISNGSFITNNFYVNVDFRTTLEGDVGLTMDLGTSEFISRSFTYGSASNYTIDASQATFIFSSNFTPGVTNGQNTVLLNDLVIRQSNSTDDGDINNDITVNNLVVEAGSPITISSGVTVTANQIEMIGTAENPILLSSSIAGETGTLVQTTGTVDAEFLEIKDNIALGGATFNALSSINLGNTSGWTFFKTEQTIDFPVIVNKAYNVESFVLEGTATSGLDIVYEIISGPATVDGDVVTLDGAIGTVQVKASQPGDILYFPAQSVINQFEVTGLSQEISFPDLGALTYGDVAIDLMASSTVSLLPIAYSSSDENLATINQSNQLEIHGAGDITITAMQTGNDTVIAAISVEQIISIAKADLSIVSDSKSIVFGEALPVFTYQITGFVNGDVEADLATPVMISSSATDQSNIGTYSITIGGATSDNYNISFVNSELVIDKFSQVITFNPSSSVDISSGTLVLSATSDSGLPVTLNLVSGPATLSGNTLTFTGTGVIVVTATQDGNENTYPAEDVVANILVNDGSKTDQTITFNEITDKAYGDVINLTASSTSGLTVSFTVIEGPAQVTGSSLSITGLGNIMIRASQGGNSIFNPAISVERTFNAQKATLTVTADNKSKTFGDPNPALTMSFQGFVNDDDENGVTIPSIGTTASIASDAGEYDITLTGGSAALYQLTLVKGVLTVEKADATITFANLTQDADGTEKFPVITTDPEGLAFSVTYNGASTPPIDAGDYEVIVTISDTNYQGQASETFSLNSLLFASMEEFGISVFPNPTQEYLQLKGVNHGLLSLLDMSGKAIWSGKIKPMISLKEVPAGNYVLLINDHQLKEQFQLRIIKKH